MKEEVMRSVTPWQIEMWPWYALGIVWAIAATRDKPDRATEPLPARLLDGIYVGFALALLFLHVVPGKVLYQRFLPSSEDLQWLGVVLTYAGAGVAIWARVALGDNWSSRVNVRSARASCRGLSKVTSGRRGL
jgi:protein-S-isoprenylcysteine O-methyltransferase Ste14